MPQQTVGVPYSIYNITSGSTVAITAKYVIGVVNNSTSAQSITITLYDGTAASGTVLANISNLGATQVITFPAPGLPVATQILTIVPSGAPIATSVQILYGQQYG